MPLKLTSFQGSNEEGRLEEREREKGSGKKLMKVVRSPLSHAHSKASSLSISNPVCLSLSPCLSIHLTRLREVAKIKQRQYVRETVVCKRIADRERETIVFV